MRVQPPVAAQVPLMRFYKIPVSNLIALYDDLDIDCAALRLRKQGSHGGHNGMRSIIANLGGVSAFPRLRIGIGRPRGSTPVAAHVLTPFDRAEAAEIAVTIAQAGDTVRAILSDGVEKATNSTNRSEPKQPKPPKPPRPPKPPTAPRGEAVGGAAAGAERDGGAAALKESSEDAARP